MKQALLVKLVPERQDQYVPAAHSGDVQRCLQRHRGRGVRCTACANKIELQKLVYYDIRAAVRLVGADVHPRHCQGGGSLQAWTVRYPASLLGAHGAMTYDERILSFPRVDRVSLLTLEGRIDSSLPLRRTIRQRGLDRMRGQADLLYRNGVFYLACTVDAPEPTPD